MNTPSLTGIDVGSPRLPGRLIQSSQDITIVAGGEDTFTSQSSQDGKLWMTFSVHQQPLPAAAYLGLAATSHNVNQPIKAVFSQLNFSQQP